MARLGKVTRGQHLAIVRDALPCALRSRNGFTWWLHDKRLRTAADFVSSIACSAATRDKGEPVLTDAVSMASTAVLKQSDRRLVIRAGNGDRRLVAKVFYLPRLEDRLRYYRFALNEAVNLLRADRLGIPVPRLYGYGYRRQHLLVSTSVALMEDLVDYQPVNGLILAKETDEEALSDILAQTIPVFTALYENACNHIDLNGEAIMLNVLDPSRTPRILDLQHAVFCERPSAEVLMAQAGRFASRYRQGWLQSPLADWLEDLLDSVNIRSIERRAKLRERFEFYRDNDLSRSQRRSIR